MNHVPAKAKFYLCDDVREEALGKMTLVGLFADDKVFVHLQNGMPAPPPGAVALIGHIAIACVLFDGEGSFPVHADLFRPSGQQVGYLSAPQLTFKTGTTATFVLKGPNFPVHEYGKYSCKVFVDTTVFPFDFEILQGPSLPVGPGASLSSPPTLSGSAVKKKRGKRSRARKAK